MGKQILESNNYARFELTAFNRDAEKTKLLEKSMLKHGWIDACPLHVVRTAEGKLLIKQGHHRFNAARKLGIPIKYVECNDEATIHELEKTTKHWNLADYLTSYCRVGLPEYIKVREFCDDTGISIPPAVSMLGGHSAGSGNFQEAFKDGTYKTKKECGHAECVKSIILHFKKHSVKFYNAALLVQAVSKIAWLEALDIAQFKSKVKLYHGIMEKRANLEQYLDMLEELYNRQSRSKLPLKFLATEEAKRRNAVGLGKK
jgi:hypothetical protein